MVSQKFRDLLKKVFIMGFGAFVLFASSHAWAGVVPFAKRKQRLLYQATSTQYDIEIDKEGVKFRYNFTGSQAIAVQNYCGFWLAVCEEDNFIGITLLPSIPSLNPGG